MPQQEISATSVQQTPEAFAEINGMPFCWDSFGDTGDPALFLVAGMGAQMVSWDDDFCIRLAARGFRVIRVDNRDSGRSVHLAMMGIPDLRWAMMRAMWRLPIHAPYLLDDMAQDIVGLMDVLGIAKAHFVGFSMGGGIAQTLAIEHPARVLSLTSIGSTTGAPDLPQPDGYVVSRVMRPAPAELDKYVDYYTDTWKLLRAGRFPDEEARDRERAVRIHGRGLYPQGAARHTMAILASGSRRSALRYVTVPTQVIHGDLDPLVLPEAGLDTARSIPDARMLMLEEMGHSIPLPLWPPIIDAIAANAARA